MKRIKRVAEICMVCNEAVRKYKILCCCKSRRPVFDDEISEKGFCDGFVPSVEIIRIKKKGLGDEVYEWEKMLLRIVAKSKKNVNLYNHVEAMRKGGEG